MTDKTPVFAASVLQDINALQHAHARVLVLMRAGKEMQLAQRKEQEGQMRRNVEVREESQNLDVFINLMKCGRGLCCTAIC